MGSFPRVTHAQSIATERYHGPWPHSRVAHFLERYEMTYVHLMPLPQEQWRVFHPRRLYYTVFIPIDIVGHGFPHDLAVHRFRVINDRIQDPF